MAAYAGNISGNKSHARKYQVDGGITIDSGEPVITGTDVAANGGATTASTTTAAAMLGFAIDTATSTDAQATTGSNVQSVSTIATPDALWKARLNNGATSGTALAVVSAAQAASAGGTVITGATDEATIWAYSGANVGTGWRRATAAATVVVAFPNAIAAGDEFLETLVHIGVGTQMATLTTDLTEVVAGQAVATTDYGVFDLLLRDQADDGLNNSYALLFAGDHAFKPANS